jgi:hypothetical protein
MSEDKIAALYVIPYDTDRLALITPKYFGLLGSFSQLSTLPIFGFIDRATGSVRDLYQETPIDSGHTHNRTMTGRGFLRFDSRQDVRKIFGIGRLMYPAQGDLIDGAFTIKGPLPGGTEILVDVNAFFVPFDTFGGRSSPPPEVLGSTGYIHVSMYDAFTGLPLATGSPGTFLSVAGHNTYFCRFTLHASTDRFVSPILYGYSVSVQGEILPRGGTFVTGGNIRSVDIQGPTKDPASESMTLELKDPRQTIPLLRLRDGIHSDLVIVNDANVVFSRLFEGQTARPDAHQRANANVTSSYTSWWDYDGLRFSGLFGRLGEQVPLVLHSFLEDPDGSVDENGNRNPWFVWRIIRFLLNDCGVPDDEIDIPLYFRSIRLWPSPKLNGEDYQMLPGGDQPYLRMIQKLCRDYLGAIFLRDPNAGARGMWRVMQNPFSTDPPKAYFYQYRSSSGSGIRSFQNPARWPNGTFIVRDSFHEWTERAEINYVNVVGGATPADGDTITHKVECEYYNFVSHDFFPGTATSALVNPFHPDYLGRFVPVYIVDPTILGAPATIMYAARIMQVAGHGRKGATWTSPLILIFDTDDPMQVYHRPLRINDIIYVQLLDGTLQKAVIRQVTPQWSRSDRIRMARYECMYIYPDVPGAIGHIGPTMQERLRARYSRVSTGAKGGMNYREEVWALHTDPMPERLQLLPTDTTSILRPQNLTTGAAHFMVGFSPVGSLDPVA